MMPPAYTIPCSTMGKSRSTQEISRYVRSEYEQRDSAWLMTKSTAREGGLVVAPNEPVQVIEMTKPSSKEELVLSCPVCGVEAEISAWALARNPICVETILPKS